VKSWFNTKSVVQHQVDGEENSRRAGLAARPFLVLVGRFRVRGCRSRHGGNRRGAAIAMALFASAASVAIVMIAAQERPFAGHFAVTPTPLEQVEPTLLPQ
jgi:hypothetical protein